MDTETYAFEVGPFECVAVNDGTFAYPEPAAFLFGDPPKERLEEALRRYGLQPEEWAQWVSPYTCLMINTGQQHVLVDTGAADLAPTTGNLPRNLQAVGIEVEDIDAVILTHGHPDHIGGTTDTEGTPAFPNARYVMSKDEWDFWTSAPSLDALTVDQHLKELSLMVAQNKLPPTQGQLDLVEHETEIVPGVRAVGAPGHTPGHMAVAISADGEQLLYTSDAALHPIHLEHPDWCPQVDLTPQQAVASRRQLFGRAAADKALMLAFHFPFPGLGRVIEKAGAWRWEPVQTTG